MKRLVCFIKAVVHWIKTGIWKPHTYGETTFKYCIIASNGKKFRVCKDYNHKDNEKLYPRATLLKTKCTYCGKELTSWYEYEVPNIK